MKLISYNIKMLPLKSSDFLFLKNKFYSVMSYDETGKITNNFYLQ